MPRGKHINNTATFSYPWEKMMTANNRMIWFKSRSVEFNQSERVRRDDQPVKIVLSEDTGIGNFLREGYQHHL